jgi:hypothetical protein
MNLWSIFFSFFAFFNGVLFFLAYFECKKKNVYGLTRLLSPLGMYVWGDVLIFSIFWTVVSLISLLLSDVYLFFLIVSLFWVVRSFGETIYWFLQQFSSIQREPPKNVELYPLLQNDSVWFVQQIKNQCITVVALVFSIYFAARWLNTLVQL